MSNIKWTPKQSTTNGDVILTKDEIKVLESILFRLYCDSPISKKYGLELDKNECKLLLDYITNLQEENERLNNIIDELRKMLYKMTLDEYDIYTANIICDMQSDFEEIIRENELKGDNK